MLISERAVEAAVAAVYGDGLEVLGEFGSDMRMALHAAAPHMLAEAWEQGRDAEFQRSVMKRQTDPNPYRSQS